MAIKAKFFNGVEYDATDVNEQFQYFYTNGIVSNTGNIGNSFAVSRKAGLILAVASGAYCIQGAVCEIYDGGEEIILDAADADLARIDTVAVEHNLSTSVHTIRIVAIKGMPASTPEAPELQNTSTIYQEPLADVLIPAGATEAGTITDRRQLIAYQRLSSAEFISHKNNRSNPHGVTAAQTGAQTAYTSLEQIGLTVDTASSYAAVHNAMPANSTLAISWTGTATTGNFGAFGQLMPADYGTCVIRKNQVSSWTFYKYDTGIIHSGTYTATNDVGWTGWKNCTIQIPTQTMRYDMGGCASTSSAFRAYGPVAVTKYGTWARIDFAISPGNISWTGIDAGNYYAYGIPLATLRSLTGLPLNYANDVLIPGQAFFKVDDATVNGGICGGFQVKGGFLCPGRWYFADGTYQFGSWTANGPCNVNGAIWSGTINVGT